MFKKVYLSSSMSETEILGRAELTLKYSTHLQCSNCNVRLWVHLPDFLTFKSIQFFKNTIHLNLSNMHVNAY